ncbi:hypothetical protein JR316_0007313 [Psilocybe cubensis]|uniref:Uncharacterized protein n=2 Tax=Psilocybe cubensis TaxID=181762 RepID=A0ACB8GYJ1_PSICU|nr:hypothetical protein JR316_0007313 [Psilocybe cubensis]KAH9480713.1 hypothetical protein JR316_0007313 [Psilocybe cubensis]
MSRHEEVLQKLNPNLDTRLYGEELMRQVSIKTGPGSGYNMDKYLVGIPAVLNNGDVSELSARTNSCIAPAEYRKLYDIVYKIVDEMEKREIEYDVLHERYGTQSLHSALQTFFIQVEKELLRLDKLLKLQMKIVTATAYFWVCVSAKFKTIPDTMVYSKQLDLHMKNFVHLLELLNENCSALKKSIERKFKGKIPSLTIDSNVAVASTPRQSPRKNINDIVEEPMTPSKRQTRQSNSDLQAMLATSPIKRVTMPSPTKIAQPSPLRGLPGKKVPIRELPSKDSPKKRAVEKNGADDMDINSPAITESPSKKRKVESPIKAIAEFSSVVASPSTRKTSVVPEVLITSVKKNVVDTTHASALRSSPRKQEVVVESESSSDESEPEMNSSRRRFRPVYLDLKQWNARDPRLDRIWKKAGKQCRKLAAAGPPGESDSMEID